MSSRPPITVIVGLYSILRERDGRIVDRLEIELPADSQVSDVLSRLDVPNHLEVVLSINDQIVNDTAVLHDHDHLRIIPAIAGGVGNY